MLHTQNFPHNIQLTVDYDSDPISPLDMTDNPVKFHCFHRRYRLGNSHLSLEEAQALTLDPDYLTLPLYMYEHSGITISTAPFSCGWDSGQLGIVSVHIPTARAYFGQDADLTKILEEDTEGYASYLEGCVYRFTITKDGDPVDTCGNLLGDENYCISEGQEAVKRVLEDLDAKAAQNAADLELAYQNL